MAPKKKSEGAEVRAAFDGPDVEHDALIGNIEHWNREDAERASSAGETRQEIGQFIEETQVNGKALSFARQILKQKKQENAMDMILSMETMLPMIKAHVSGQGTADMFMGDTDDTAHRQPEDGPPPEPDTGDPDFEQQLQKSYPDVPEGEAGDYLGEAAE